MAEMRVPDWRITLTLDVYRKMKDYTKAADGEWSGLGSFELGEHGPVVTDLHLLDQECTAADTEIDEKAACKLMYDLAVAGCDKPLNVWVHSHATMGVFWSQKDEQDGIGQMLGAPPFLVSIVMNKAGEMLGRVDVKEPVRFTMNKVLVVADTEDLALYAVHAAEIAAKVRPPAPRSYGKSDYWQRGRGSWMERVQQRALGLDDFDDVGSNYGGGLIDPWSYVNGSEHDARLSMRSDVRLGAGARELPFPPDDTEIGATPSGAVFVLDVYGRGCYLDSAKDVEELLDLGEISRAAAEYTMEQLDLIEADVRGAQEVREEMLEELPLEELSADEVANA